MSETMQGSAASGVAPVWVASGTVLQVRDETGTCFVPTADEIFRFAVEGEVSESLPLPFSIEGLGTIRPSRVPVTLELRIERSSSGRDLRVTAYALLKSQAVPLPGVAERRADHLLVGRDWYPFAQGSLQDLRSILSEAGLPDTGTLTLRQYLALLTLAAAERTVVDLSGRDNAAFRPSGAPESVTPAGFHGTLYPYQRDGVQWLDLLSSQDLGGILADEMGLGKTVQLAAFLVQQAADGKGASLVIATGTLLENWRRELARFAPGLRVHVHQGPDRTGNPRDLRQHQVIVCSYDTLVRDLSMFRQVEWNVVILDEAQAIKNFDTRRAQAVKQLPRRTGVAVTGTPVENHLNDLWSLADFAIPGFLGPLRTFEATFENNVEGAERLEPLITPVMLRRIVADVAKDLPERIDIPQPLQLPTEQAVAYENMRQTILQEFGTSATLVALTKLRMFCTHPTLLGVPSADLCADSAKYQRLTEILEEIFACREKAIIFTSYQQMADLLTEDLARRFSVSSSFIDGRIAVGARQDAVDRFSNTIGPAVLILNPRAAGTGLNITAANHVIHYNLEWNPAVEDQASARAYRRGQTRPVTVHRLYYVDTVEEVIDDRVASKRALAEAAIRGTDGRDESLLNVAAALSRSPVLGSADRVR